MQADEDFSNNLICLRIATISESKTCNTVHSIPTSEHLLTEDTHRPLAYWIPYRVSGGKTYLLWFSDAMFQPMHKPATELLVSIVCRAPILNILVIVQAEIGLKYWRRRIAA